MEFCEGCEKAIIAANIERKVVKGKEVYVCRDCGTEVPYWVASPIASSEKGAKYGLDKKPSIDTDVDGALKLQNQPSKKLNSTF